MKYAFCSNLGKEISTDDIDKGIISSTQIKTFKFYCPECGEIVHYRNWKNKNPYFAHDVYNFMCPSSERNDENWWTELKENPGGDSNINVSMAANSNFNTFIDTIIKLANQGSAEAQFIMGNCYDMGYGVPVNHKEAFKWYKKAAEQKHPSGLMNLGISYRDGEGTEPDMQKAVYYLSKAAEAGNVRAMSALGKLYFDMNDLDKATLYLKKACELGEPVAMNVLAFIYMDTAQKASDYFEGVKLLEEASSLGDADALFNLGVMYYEGDVPTDGDSTHKGYEMIVRAFKKKNQMAKQYLIDNDLMVIDFESIFRDAENGDPETQWILGENYIYGDYFDVNDEKAVYWLQKAADNDFVNAQFKVGLMYVLGEGVERNSELGMKYLKTAAEKGHLDAQYSCGRCYFDGDGVETDYEEAFKWFMKAAEQGDSSSQQFVGEMYSAGMGVEKSYDEAFKWSLKAAMQGSVEAQYSIGRAYYNGEGVDQNKIMAEKWFRKAAEQGDEESIKIMVDYFDADPDEFSGDDFDPDDPVDDW